MDGLGIPTKEYWLSKHPQYLFELGRCIANQAKLAPGAGLDPNPVKENQDDKVKINVEEIHLLKTRIRTINKLPFEQIEWYEGGIKIEPTPEQIKFWEDIGFNNVDFIDKEFYKSTQQAVDELKIGNFE